MNGNENERHQVRGLSPLSAGLVMFSGQVWDGIATPIVGILSDATPVRGPYICYTHIVYE
jgi:Na+/melibiose symporter-like transporter